MLDTSFLLSFATAGIVIVLTIAYWLRLLPSGQLDPHHKAVVITGCDTGFGQAIAQHLDSIGCHVFAGCLDAGGEGAKRLCEGASERLVVVQMDVTKDEEVSAAMEIVKEKLPHPEKGLWGIVNNAGLANFGLIEWCTMADYKQVTEVNVFGGIRVIKTFLPLIRQAKGRIVNTISILGRKATPGRSCYVSSKHAMEGFTQCLRLEMRQWDVHVSIIEPGNFVAATGIFTKEKVQAIASKLWTNMSDSIRRDYGKENFDSYVRKIEGFVSEGCREKSPVIDCVLRALFDKRPRIRYSPKSFDEHVMSFLMTHMPHEIGDYIYKQ